MFHYRWLFILLSLVFGGTVHASTLTIAHHSNLPKPLDALLRSEMLCASESCAKINHLLMQNLLHDESLRKKLSIDTDDFETFRFTSDDYELLKQINEVFKEGHQFALKDFILLIDYRVLRQEYLKVKLKRPYHVAFSIFQMVNVAVKGQNLVNAKGEEYANLFLNKGKDVRLLGYTENQSSTKLSFGKNCSKTECEEHVDVIWYFDEYELIEDFRLGKIDIVENPSFKISQALDSNNAKSRISSEITDCVLQARFVDDDELNKKILKGIIYQFEKLMDASDDLHFSSKRKLTKSDEFYYQSDKNYHLSLVDTTFFSTDVTLFSSFLDQAIKNVGLANVHLESNKTIKKSSYDGAVLTLIDPFNNNVVFQSMLAHCRKDLSLSGLFNFTNYCNDEIDQLFDDVIYEGKELDSLLKLIDKKAPYVSIVNIPDSIWYNDRVDVSDMVTGYQIGSYGAYKIKKAD